MFYGGMYRKVVDAYYDGLMVIKLRGWPVIELNRTDVVRVKRKQW